MSTTPARKPDREPNIPLDFADNLRNAGCNRAIAGAAFLAALVVGGGVAALDTENIVETVFDRSLSRVVASTAATGQAATAAAPSRFNGIAGSEAFWLGIANPEIARVVAVGQPLTLRSGGGLPDRGLVVVDVRHVQSAASPEGDSDAETRIDTRASDIVYLIICRDRNDPNAGEFYLELRNGEISVIGAEAPRIL